MIRNKRYTSLSELNDDLMILFIGIIMKEFIQVLAI